MCKPPRKLLALFFKKKMYLGYLTKTSVQYVIVENKIKKIMLLPVNLILLIKDISFHA